MLGACAGQAATTLPCVDTSIATETGDADLAEHRQLFPERAAAEQLLSRFVELLEADLSLDPVLGNRGAEPWDLFWGELGGHSNIGPVDALDTAHLAELIRLGAQTENFNAERDLLADAFASYKTGASLPTGRFRTMVNTAPEVADNLVACTHVLSVYAEGSILQVVMNLGQGDDRILHVILTEDLS